MAGFMPKMAEQSPIWLPECDPAAIAFDVVGLSKIERYHALCMSSHDKLSGGFLRQNIEPKTSAVSPDEG